MKQNTQTQAATRGLNLFAMLVCIFILRPVDAASFSVSPIRVDLSAQESIAALTIKNPSNSDISIHAKIYQWTQNNGRDQLDQTANLLVTPPIFTIPANGLQIMRVGLKTAPDPNEEISYRLHLTEIPTAKTEQTQGLSIATRISLPIFVAPTDNKAKFNIQWKVDISPEQVFLLSAENTGDGHAKVTEIQLNKIDGNPISKTGNDYILPGSKHIWPLPYDHNLHKKGDEVELGAKVNNEWVRALVPVR